LPARTPGAQQVCGLQPAKDAAVDGCVAVDHVDFLGDGHEDGHELSILHQLLQHEIDPFGEDHNSAEIP
jgi:hypothetical protein